MTVVLASGCSKEQARQSSDCQQIADNVLELAGKHLAAQPPSARKELEASKRELDQTLIRSLADHVREACVRKELSQRSLDCVREASRATQLADCELGEAFRLRELIRPDLDRDRLASPPIDEALPRHDAGATAPDSDGAGSPDPTAPSTSGLDSCDAQRTAITRAADLAGACTADDQCVIMAAHKCNIDGLFCYQAAVNKDNKTEIAALKAALGAYGPTCAQSRCRCKQPKTVRCESGRCRP